MRIDEYKVDFSSTHSSFSSFSLSQEYFSFQENLQDAKVSFLEKATPISDDIFTQDFIIHELTKAILKNLIVLKRRARTDSFRLDFSTFEKESMNFQTKAYVKSGGKTIDVDIDVNIERSFISKTRLNSFGGIFTDPLVLSLDNDMPALSQKSFVFDIDSDGEKDQISMLSTNSAFLALDKNGSLTIDCADELFGAKSGDGFYDLSLYDEDNNSWIDENDSIFDGLRVWKKNENEDTLLALGEVGIGAIYLGNTQTEFSMNDTLTNSALGKMKRSGFFLKENGDNGVTSQIDFAKQNGLKNTLDLLDKKTSSPKQEQEDRASVSYLKEYLKQLQLELIGATDEEQASINQKIAQTKAKISEMMV